MLAGEVDDRGLGLGAQTTVFMPHGGAIGGPRSKAAMHRERATEGGQ